MIKTFFFGSNSFDANANTNVANATIEYIISTKRFEEPLFQWKEEIFKKYQESVMNSVFIAVVYCIIGKILFLFSQAFFYSQIPLKFSVSSDCLF